MCISGKMADGLGSGFGPSQATGLMLNATAHYLCELMSPLCASVFYICKTWGLHVQYSTECRFPQKQVMQLNIFDSGLHESSLRRENYIQQQETLHKRNTWPVHKLLNTSSLPCLCHHLCSEIGRAHV